MTTLRETPVAEIESLERRLAMKKSALDVFDRSAAVATAGVSRPSLHFVLIAKAAELTGYTRNAIELKIKRGVWVEGREWRKAPDGHRMIDLAGVARWVEGGRPR